jgi:hypothetical protein
MSANPCSASPLRYAQGPGSLARDGIYARLSLYRFKTRRMACDLGIYEISYAAR